MSFWNKLVDQFRRNEEFGAEIDWEALLIEADLGVTLAVQWVDELKEAGLTRAPEKAEAFLREKMLKLVRIPPPLPIKHKPEVILLIGVNGSGKTTTAAKLGWRAKQEGRSVRLGAADTFRAAAAEQLEAWGARLEIPVTSAAPGTDPASVAVRSLLAAQEAKSDLLIIDTAGRQANKRNLLLELQKMKRRLQKKEETVPHHTWLVADGTTGTGVHFAGAGISRGRWSNGTDRDKAGWLRARRDGRGRAGGAGLADLLSGPRRKAGGFEAVRRGGVRGGFFWGLNVAAPVRAWGD